MISALVSVYGRPWFHPHELYSSIGGVPVATAVHLIGNSLLKELDQIAEPKYSVQKDQYDHEAYQRSVEKIKEYDAERMSKLSEIHTVRKLLTKRVHEIKEDDATMMMNTKLKKICTAKPEEKDEDWFNNYARDMDVMIEKTMKKESKKRRLRRSLRKQKH